MSVQLLWELHALFSEGVYTPLVPGELPDTVMAPVRGGREEIIGAGDDD